MFNSKFDIDHPEFKTADFLVPVIRVAATVGFVVAPCSLGFVIIALSDHLIRSIMVGDDPEMLVSNLQNQFPHDTIALAEDVEGLVAHVVQLVDRPQAPAQLAYAPAGGQALLEFQGE